MLTDEQKQIVRTESLKIYDGVLTIPEIFERLTSPTITGYISVPRPTASLELIYINLLNSVGMTPADSFEQLFLTLDNLEKSAPTAEDRISVFSLALRIKSVADQLRVLWTSLGHPEKGPGDSTGLSTEDAPVYGDPIIPFPITIKDVCLAVSHIDIHCINVGDVIRTKEGVFSSSLGKEFKVISVDSAYPYIVVGGETVAISVENIEEIL